SGRQPAAGEQKLSHRLARIEPDPRALAARTEELVRQWKPLVPAGEGIARLESNLDDLVGQQDEVFRQLRRLHAGVDGLVRAQFLEPDTLLCPQRLSAHGFSPQ